MWLCCFVFCGIKLDNQTLGPTPPSISTFIHLRKLPALEWVSASENESDPKQSYTVYEYDQTALTSCPNISGYDSSISSQQGNVTTLRRKLTVGGGAASGSDVVTRYEYDIAGNRLKTIDPRGNAFETQYAFEAGYAYPTHMKTPIPDSTKFHGADTALERTTEYDYSTGLPISTLDANSQTTTVEYNDALDRPTKINYPDGGWTRYLYGDAVGNLYVSSFKRLDPSREIESKQLFDGLGRVVQSALNEGTTWINTDTLYDAMGRVWKVSNPYRTGETPVWTTTLYDTLGRVNTVTTPDNAVLTTTYSGNLSTVTDQALKRRRSENDGLGRLVKVTEDPLGTPLDTTYLYDALDNLRRVTQGSQQRYFLYDSLSRLVRAKNPEQDNNTNLPAQTDPLTGNGQWSFAYAYDSNGNLTSRTDPRNTVTAYSYDLLNRLFRRTYTTAGSTVATPEVTVTYDGANDTGSLATSGNFRGRMTLVKNSDSLTLYGGYDSLGRVLASTQTTPASGGQSYALTYQYNLAGGLTSQRFPSQRVLETEYDTAGRVVGVRNQSGSYYAGSTAGGSNPIQYAAQGAIKVMKLGNNLWEHTLFNSRAATCRNRLGNEQHRL